MLVNEVQSFFVKYHTKYGHEQVITILDFYCICLAMYFTDFLYLLVKGHDQCDHLVMLKYERTVKSMTTVRVI